MKNNFVSLAAIGLLIAPLASADVLPDGPHVYVEGSAELDVEPDRLVVTVTIAAVDQQVKLAKADVDRRSAVLIESCKAVGVEPADLSSTSLGVGPSYRYENDARVFEGTRVQRQIEISLRDLSRYSELIRAIVEADIAEIDETSLYAASSAELEDRALEAALADAKQRAQRLAAASGAKLGEVYSISEFQMRVQEFYLLASSRYTTTGPSSVGGLGGFVATGEEVPAEVFTPGLLKARAEVFVVFELEP